MSFTSMARAIQLSIISFIIGTSISQADTTTSYTYTQDGEIATIDGPRIDVSDITTYSYDAQGNRTSITNALSQVTQVTAHDAIGRPLTIVDPNGLITSLTYDPRGRLTQHSLSDSVTNRTTQYSYDPVGNLIQVTQPDGGFIAYEYDSAHRLIGMEDNQGNRIDYTLDAMGNRLSEQVGDPQGNLTRTQQWLYDELGQIRQLTDSQNNSTVFTRDKNGNVTQSLDANQNPDTKSYDAVDRVKLQTNALNGTTQYTYDAQDNITSVTDPNNLTTTYEYDYLGNVTSQTSPDTGTTTYTYDEAGNRLSKTDARGITVNYSYDALNRLTQVSYPDSNLNVSYMYDQGSNGIGRLTSMIDANGTTTYAYNAYGDLVSQTRTSSDSIVTTFSYVYDGHWRLATLTYPSGNSVNYTYDVHGQLNTLTYEWSDSTTQTLVSNLQKLPFGPLEAFDYGNGLSLTRSFDQDYHLTGQTIPGLLQSSYQHDAVGNITDWQDLLSTGQDQLFEYDSLYRLTSASGTYGDLTYSYDATGNRLSLTLDGSTETYSYVPSSHQLQHILGSVTDSRTYDAAGNTLQSLIGNYTYDDTNRMVSFTKTGTTATYAYNGKGERISKNVDGAITRFRYGPAGQLLGEYDQTGQAIREYITLESQPIALIVTDPQTTVASIYYLHTDHLGSVVKATDSSQGLVWDAERKPFGERALITELIKMPLGFPGQYFDEESGNYYNYFRDYDPTIGRYLQSDPIGLDGGINTYAYVGGNSIRRIDIYGLAWAPCEGNSAAECWVPSPNTDSVPECATPECSAGLPPAPSDNRSVCEIDKGQCKWACGISSGFSYGPINTILGLGIPGAVTMMTPRTQGFCEWVCQE
ncbi:MAG: RHS repeat-associated core domain-containing protein [Candidatus Thiodiazotropha sp.]